MKARDGITSPNIVFIVADDLGWSDVACYGGDLHETPNIDRLAAQGVRFTDAYASAPVCSPTRASIMCGKHPARINLTIWSEAAKNPPQNRKLVPPVVEDRLSFEHRTFAEALCDEYFMAHVGKWHLGPATHYPEARGFHTNVGGTHWGCPPTFFYPWKGRFSTDPEFRYVPGIDRGNEKPGTYLTDRLTDVALEVIENANRNGRPFFLNMWYYTVHVPIEGKEEWVAHFRDRIRPDMKHRNAGYAAMVRSLDENVGRILAKLDELGIADNTIVIFTSDNGGYIGQWKGETVTDNFPLRSGKGSVYEGGIRVPLIVRWPKVTPPGSVCSEPVASADLYATFLDVTGRADHPLRNEEVDGVSLVPLLRDPAASLGREALYWHYPHYYPTTTPVGAIRAGRWKLIEYFETGSRELYDLSTDIGESQDLAESNPAKVDELHSMLVEWRRSVGARMPAPSQQ